MQTCCLDLHAFPNVTECSCVQEEAMVSSKDIAEKYKSFKEYEDDFM